MGVADHERLRQHEAGVDVLGACRQARARRVRHPDRPGGRGTGNQGEGALAGEPALRQGGAADGRPTGSSPTSPPRARRRASSTSTSSWSARATRSRSSPSPRSWARFPTRSRALWPRSSRAGWPSRPHSTAFAAATFESMSQRGYSLPATAICPGCGTMVTLPPEPLYPDSPPAICATCDTEVPDYRRESYTPPPSLPGVPPTTSPISPAEATPVEQRRYSRGGLFARWAGSWPSGASTRSRPPKSRFTGTQYRRPARQSIRLESVAAPGARPRRSAPWRLRPCPRCRRGGTRAGGAPRRGRRQRLSGTAQPTRPTASFRESTSPTAS